MAVQLMKLCLCSVKRLQVFSQTVFVHIIYVSCQTI